jgi:alkanesulfonate monooxygenase SsuD/methylene tetrahydromethanopterin reductase-like flavin-dependent oxidoreductase (luciferase family)
MLEEQLAIIDGMWTTPAGEPFTFEGKHFQLDESPALPKPVQQPRPPIILGGWGTKRTPRLAARYADEFNMPFAPVGYYREGCDHVRVACEKVDRDPATMRFTVALVACVGRDDAEFERRADAIGHKPEDLRANAAGGLPGEVVERIHAFAEAGAETVYLQVLDLDDHDHLRLIAAEVAPHV